MEMIELLNELRQYGDTCDHCVGRFYAKRSFGLSNDERGHAIRVAHALKENIPFENPKEACWICGNFFETADLWAKRAEDALSGIECSTFLVGCKVPPLMSESEEMIWSDYSLQDPEPLKSEINREIGKLISARTGLEVNFTDPDVVLLLDIPNENVEVQIRPLFFYGRYLKFERGIPQTHWDCRKCRGRGCEECNYTGKQYPNSVEELIAKPACELFEAEKGILHGAGREDIDAVMIGTGRPFIMEITKPLKRDIDIFQLESAINESASGRVAVRDLQWSARKDVETLKSNKGHKRYRILVDIDGHVPETALNMAVNELNSVTVHQRTPKRVAHRRADKIRKRKVLEITSTGNEGNLYVLEVLGESGLYIKELISGDEGRTKPSLSEILGKPARVVQLDVLLVEGIHKES